MAILIALHNLLRWVVVILAAAALYRAYSGWLGKKEWQDGDRKVGVFFGAAMDTQLLLGGILYFFGAWGYKAFAIAQQAPTGQKLNLLFFAVEHAITMLLAVVLVHVGTVMARRATDAVSKHKLAALWFSAAVLLVLVAIPWMQRPLLPAF